MNGESELILKVANGLALNILDRNYKLSVNSVSWVSEFELDCLFEEGLVPVENDVTITNGDFLVFSVAASDFTTVLMHVLF